VATSPLIQAVENLSTFANNPEFASIPAQISHEVGVQGGCRVACVGAVGESLFFYRRNDREKRLKISFIPSHPNPQWSLVQRHEGKVFVMNRCVQFPENGPSL
jgi:talin